MLLLLLYFVDFNLSFSSLGLAEYEREDEGTVGMSTV
jgi:hypothetical protein